MCEQKKTRSFVICIYYFNNRRILGIGTFHFDVHTKTNSEDTMTAKYMSHFRTQLIPYIPDTKQKPLSYIFSHDPKS